MYLVDNGPSQSEHSPHETTERMTTLSRLYHGRLSNQGNIPAFFSFQPDSTGAFSTKPAAGVIPAGDFQVMST